MSRKNVFITIVVVLIGAAVVVANVYYKKDKGLAVTTDVIKARDLEAIVSASGKIQPKRTSQHQRRHAGPRRQSSGQRRRPHHKGQFLLQIDPKSLSVARRQRLGVAAGQYPDARSRCASRSRPRAPS